MSTPADGDTPAHADVRLRRRRGRAGDRQRRPQQPPGRSGAADFGPQSFNLTGRRGDRRRRRSSTADGCAVGAHRRVAGQDRADRSRHLHLHLKAQNAQAAGAVGVIIANNATTGPAAASSAPAQRHHSRRCPSRRPTAHDAQDRRPPRGTVSRHPDEGPRSSTATAPSTTRSSPTSGATTSQNRLIGDGNGLDNNQGGGMGEGWGDFHAMLMVVKDGDAQLPANAELGRRLRDWPATPATAPTRTATTSASAACRYSTDMTKNGLTFKHIADGNAAALQRADRVRRRRRAATPRCTTPARCGPPCCGSATRRCCATPPAAHLRRRRRSACASTSWPPTRRPR